MFENQEIANDVLERFLRINDEMEDAIRATVSRTSPEELVAFKRAVGHLMYEVFAQVVEPICKRHPSLRPPEMES